MRPLATLLPALLLALPAAAQDEPERAPEVPVRLLADRTGIAPGGELEVAVHLSVPAGWHVYWANPGDTGMATTAELRVPLGFEVEGPRFPGPTRYEDGGGLVSFVHEGDVVLFFRVRAPARLPAEEPVRLKAVVRWLVCKEACFVGSAEPELELPVVDEPAAADAATLRLLGTHRARLPRPFEELDGDPVVEWLAVPVAEGERERFLFRLERSAEGELEFFAAPGSPLETVRQARETSGGWRRLAVELARRPGEPAEPPRIRGVLRLESAGRVAYFDLDRAGPPTLPRDR